MTGINPDKGRVPAASAIPKLATELSHATQVAARGQSNNDPAASSANNSSYDLSEIPSLDKQAVAKELLKEPLLNLSEGLVEREADLKRTRLQPLREALERLSAGTFLRDDTATLRTAQETVNSLVVTGYSPTNLVPPTSGQLLKEISDFNALAATLAPKKNITFV